MQPDEITEVLTRPISKEMLARDVTRLAYVVKDGTPRTVPISFVWNGAQIVLCTTPNAPKLAALKHNPAVALTIDTEVHPPKILLIRVAPNSTTSTASRTSTCTRPPATR